MQLVVILQALLVTDEEIRRSSKNQFFQKQEGRGSEDFEEWSLVNLNEHRGIENDEEIRRLSKNQFFQKQEGRGSEDFEEWSLVNLDEHREIENDDEIRRLSKN
ncbi:hypothetical protein [Fictibacillus barbaricus]|uniref:Uncharacterized protein n=1 Tax=Fictibacillus barbaricus TaxID=182136 RepID=A0ABU1TVJ4_9BACL|nr:hypothetical protein [Fictibacillus barbaricus]MDR7071239.1 hypothetical protein [Fictibacillus barbaricus]